jgi:6-pyruvoyltetrahydropterin/6-carboxytetrahydropterin synthase
MHQPRFSIQLAKEDFKFSAAHFTVFDGARAELLHGHNYRVSVELSGESLDEDGFLVDLDQVKTLVRAACADLDERTLVPGRSPHLVIDQAEGRVAVGFAERRYELPSADVYVLPIRNVTIEALAAHLWLELSAGLALGGIDRMAVIVEETAGQRCRFSAALEPPA